MKANNISTYLNPFLKLVFIQDQVTHFLAGLFFFPLRTCQANI